MRRCLGPQLPVDKLEFEKHGFALYCFLLTRIPSPGEPQVKSKTGYFSVPQTDGKANKECAQPQRKRKRPVTLPSLDCLVLKQGTMLNETASKSKEVALI